MRPRLLLPWWSELVTSSWSGVPRCPLLPPQLLPTLAVQQRDLHEPHHGGPVLHLPPGMVSAPEHSMQQPEGWGVAGDSDETMRARANLSLLFCC